MSSAYPTQGEFREAIGATFAVGEGPLGDGETVELALLEVRAHAEGEERPFSIEFRGPLDPQLPQATYVFERDGATHEIFIVPVERDDSGVVYEAVFA